MNTSNEMWICPFCHQDMKRGGLRANAPDNTYQPDKLTMKTFEDMEQTVPIKVQDHPEILSITEAYSQSPMTFTISTELKHSKASEYLAKKLIKVITRQGDRYNGYNFEGQVMFSYLVDSVNVCYNTDNV